MIPCHEYTDSSSELNLLRSLTSIAVGTSTALNCMQGFKRESIEQFSHGPDAGRRQSLPVRLAVLIAVLVLLITGLASCTGRDIGGVGAGWNGLTARNGVVYVGTKHGRVQALTDNGFEGVRPGWTFPQAEGADDLQGVYSTPVVVGNLLYVAAENGYLYALELENGSISDRGWRRPLGQPENLESLIAGPAYDPINQLVVVTSEDGNLYAYDDDTGEQIWDRPFSARDKIWSTPAVSNGIAFFGSHDGYLYSINLATGEEEWSQKTDGVIAGRPLLVDGMVVAGSLTRSCMLSTLRTELSDGNSRERTGSGQVRSVTEDLFLRRIWTATFMPWTLRASCNGSLTPEIPSCPPLSSFPEDWS